MLRRLNDLDLPRLVTLLFTAALATLILSVFDLWVSPTTVGNAQVESTQRYHDFRVASMAITSLFVIVLSAAFLWPLWNWLKGLAGAPTRLTLQQSGRHLNIWMVITILVTVLSALAALLAASDTRPGHAGIMRINGLLALVSNVVIIVAAVNARVWFLDRVSMQAGARGDRLSTVLLLLAALTLVDVVVTAFVPAQVAGRSTTMGIVHTSLTVVIAVIMAMAYVLTAQVVQRTMGPDRSTPMQPTA